MICVLSSNSYKCSCFASKLTSSPLFCFDFDLDFDGWTMTLNVNNLLHNLIDCINIWFSCSWWSVLYWWSARVFGVHWNWRTIRGFVILLFIAVKYSWTRSRAISRSSEQLFQVSEVVYVCIGVKSHNKRVKWFWYVCGHFNGKNILVSSSNILQFCVLALLEKENVFSSSNSLFIVKLKPNIVFFSSDLKWTFV